MAAAAKDEFSNFAIIAVTESAINTLTYKKLETGISLNEKVAWIISRLEYFFSPFSATTFNAANDDLSYGLSVSNQLAAVNLQETSIIDFNYISRDDLGAAASGFYHMQPFVKDFASLPGGGIIVPPVPIYAFAKGSGLTAAATVYVKLFYTLLNLSVDQYWQLVEARRVLVS